MSKLILTNEVAGLGSAGDVVEVKDGFARNYLIPQGFAVAWTPRWREAGRVDSRGPRRRVRSTTTKRPSRSRTPSSPTRSSSPSRRAPRAACSARSRPMHVADAVKAAGLGDLDKRKIHITSPIKSVGEHEATVRLRDDLTAVITLLVVAAK